MGYLGRFLIVLFLSQKTVHKATKCLPPENQAELRSVTQHQSKLHIYQQFTTETASRLW